MGASIRGSTQLSSLLCHPSQVSRTKLYRIGFSDLHSFVCLLVYCVAGGTRVRAHVKVRATTRRGISLLPPCKSWKSNSGRLA